MPMECECLYCYEKAVTRITVPRTASKTAMCDKHAAEYLKAADRYRRIPGMVQVEAIRAAGRGV